MGVIGDRYSVIGNRYWGDRYSVVGNRYSVIGESVIGESVFGGYLIFSDYQ